MISATTTNAHNPVVNPLSPSALMTSAEVPPHQDIYVTAPIMVPAPVVYTPPAVVTHVPRPNQPVMATHIPPIQRRVAPVPTGAVVGEAPRVSTVAVVDCCSCW
jgi:hypothetical protein